MSDDVHFAVKLFALTVLCLQRKPKISASRKLMLKVKKKGGGTLSRHILLELSLLYMKMNSIMHVV